MDDIALGPFLFENPVDPETIQTRLLNQDYPEALARTNSRLALEICEASQKCRKVAARDSNFDIFSPSPSDCNVITHFKRENSSETKMAARSVRTAARVYSVVVGNVRAGLHGFWAASLR